MTHSKTNMTQIMVWDKKMKEQSIKSNKIIKENQVWPISKLKEVVQLSADDKQKFENLQTKTG